MESTTGYFDPRMEQYIASFRAKHKEWLRLAQLLNVASHDVLGKATMRRGGPHGDAELVRGLYFLRSLHNYQAVITLLERGFATQAEGVCRMQLEAVFRLKAIKDKPEKLDRFIDMWHRDRATKLRNLRQCADNVADDVKRDLQSPEFAELEAELTTAAKDIEKYQSWEIAQDADLESLHKTAYTAMNDAVHSTLQSVSEYIVEGTDGTVVQLKADPSDEGAGRTFVTAIEVQLVAMKCMADLCPDAESVERQVTALNTEAKRVFALTGLS